MSDSTSQSKFDEIFEAIRRDEQNASYTAQGIDPLYSAHAEARIVIVGQAPGRIAQDTHMVWNDRSGDRLRDWLGIDRETFYTSDKLAIMPMDFYFPGTGKSGDLPPRKGFADKWHPALLALMPHVELTVLVGNYATHAYLHLKSSAKLTDIAHNYQRYLPERLPLVHPSPRNQIWMKKNPWFGAEVLPELQKRVAHIMNE